MFSVPLRRMPGQVEVHPAQERDIGGEMALYALQSVDPATRHPVFFDKATLEAVEV